MNQTSSAGRYRPAIITAILILSSPPVLAGGQSQSQTLASPQYHLTIAAALDRADRSAYPNRTAVARAAGQRASALMPVKGILPSIRFEAGYVRTTDPIGAFGTTLRQRSIRQQDFDPGRLNYPAAVGNYQGGVVLEQPLFNADAWLGRRAAGQATAAADAMTDWAITSTRLDVIKAYYGVVLATETVSTLTAALAAAQEHVRQAHLAAEQGLVTASDALLAAVRAGEVEARLVAARGDANTARVALAIALGTPRDTMYVLPHSFPASDLLRTLVAHAMSPVSHGERGDVEAARTAAAASTADEARARSLHLPRVNGFARYDWNSASQVYGGDRNWTVGVLASWAVFSGASEIAETRGTAARRRVADTELEAITALAALDDSRTFAALRAAAAAMDIAERGVEQSSGAHRIVARKYEGGLGTIGDVLDAASIETTQRLALAAAQYSVIVSAADRLRAIGLDPGAIRVLESGAGGTSLPSQ